jgi:protein SCO1
MNKASITTAAAGGLMLLASAIVCVGNASAEAGGSHWGANYFPNVALTTQNGTTVRFYDDLLKGKVVVVDLIYTHCKDSCPLETARLAQVQKLLEDRMGKDVFFYSISIDPERDTPEVLKAYAEKFHAGPGWLFLTGRQEDIDLISKKLGLYSPDWSRDGHRASLMVGNVPAGQWMRNPATDNPRLLAVRITNLLDGWKNQQTAIGENYAGATALLVSKGQYLFATRCAACHTIGHGERIGPDLLGVTGIRDRSWLAHFIQKPDQMLAEKDPLATALYEQYKQVQMPNLRLGPEDTESLVAYLEAQGAALSRQAGTIAKTVEREKSD